MNINHGSSIVSPMGKRGWEFALMSSFSLLLALGACGSEGSGTGGSDVPPENFTLNFSPDEAAQIGEEGCPDFYVEKATEQLRYISYNAGGTWQDVEVSAEPGDKRVNGTRTCVFTVKNMGVDGKYGALNNLTLTTLGVNGDKAGFDTAALSQWTVDRAGGDVDNPEGIKGISAITDDGVKMAEQAGLGAVETRVSDVVRVRATSATDALIAGFERSYDTPYKGAWALVETGDPQNPNYRGETSASQLARVFTDSFRIGFTYNKGFWK